MKLKLKDVLAAEVFVDQQQYEYMCIGQKWFTQENGDWIMVAEGLDSNELSEAAVKAMRQFTKRVGDNDVQDTK